MSRIGRAAAQLVAGICGIAAVTLACVRWLDVTNAATISASFLLVVLVVAATSPFWIAALTSLTAVLSFNYFFLPPVQTLTIADPQNWVALTAFLAVSLVASNLSAVARAKREEAEARRRELVRLVDLSRDVLVMGDAAGAMTELARSIARRFDLAFVAIALPSGDGWHVFEGGAAMTTIDRDELARVFAAAHTSPAFDADAASGPADARSLRFVALRVGTKPKGVLVTAGRAVEPTTFVTLTGLVAIAIERAQFLEERKAAELARQSAALKTALLASLGHDLRTPLTAIRLAAANIGDPAMSDVERAEQGQLLGREVERLGRLFQNVLEMARIDAGAVSVEPRWTHPSEIVAAARDHVAGTLAGRAVAVAIEPDVPVRLDPGLTALALAHVLENAGQYAPAGAAVEVDARVADGALTIRVRDHGPGIAAADLPHLFERFYRGDAATSHASGTGMGLWIARELLAAEGGRVSAANRAPGAEFSLVIPAAAMPDAAAT